ncbi:uncharacterized protein LOC114938875 isoform X2 [Nylanderia fulva]|uniref:uncharacterized protein LOC114938875 isoform X2 n=1 Tax=Nylanderia fulva TaxID=613905 RepID=UPI0010FB4C8B|nr:uncharacterized protein LOC114938875 isoform X2 [Nylanderia fulva]
MSKDLTILKCIFIGNIIILFGDLSLHSYDAFYVQSNVFSRMVLLQEQKVNCNRVFLSAECKKKVHMAFAFFRHVFRNTWKSSTESQRYQLASIGNRGEIFSWTKSWRCRRSTGRMACGPQGRSKQKIRVRLARASQFCSTILRSTIYIRPTVRKAGIVISEINNIMLRLKYTEQNLNSIRNRVSMGIFYLKSKSEFSTYNSDLSETENDFDSNTISELDDSTTPSASVQTLDHQNNEIESSIGKILDIYPTSPIKLSKNNSIEIKKLSRQKRAIFYKAQNHMIMESERNNNYTAVVQREARATKERRNRGRGKKQQKKKEKRSEKEKGRRHERNRGRFGPKVVTFIGAIPLQEFKNTGPWIKGNNNIKSNNTSYDFTKFYLREDDYSIEINMSGLYIISVQIFYVGGPVNSYWVLLNSEGSSKKRNLITCAVGSTTSEVSCYTSVTTCLQKGDRLSILQQEKNRLVNLREGYSQIQLVLLDAND